MKWILFCAGWFSLLPLAMKAEPFLLVHNDRVELSLISNISEQTVSAFGALGDDLVLLALSPPTSFEVSVHRDRYSISRGAERIVVRGLPAAIRVLSESALTESERSAVISNCVEAFLSRSHYSIWPRVPLSSLGIIDFQPEKLMTRRGAGAIATFDVSNNPSEGRHSVVLCSGYLSGQPDIVVSGFQVAADPIVSGISEWVEQNRRVYAVGSVALALVAGAFLARLERVLHPVKDLLRMILGR